MIISQMESIPKSITLPATVNSAKFLDDTTLQEIIDLRNALASNYIDVVNFFLITTVFCNLKLTFQRK